MPLTQVLVVEDDSAIRRGVCDALDSAGYAAIPAESAERGLELVELRTVDLALLDVVLPGMSGLQLLEQLKEQQPLLPAIMLTARGDEHDRVQGLRCGADDYVVKPFSVSELLARVEAVLRRCGRNGDDSVEQRLPGQRNVCWSSRRVRFADGSEVELSEREVELLKYLRTRCDQTVSRDELIRAVWQMNPRGLQTRTVDMHVARLRDKLRDTDDQSRLIVTVRGRGYRLAIAETSS